LKRVLGFSGGVDSQALGLVMRLAYPHDELIFLNSDAGGNEHPLTDGFIRWYSDSIFPVVAIQAIIADLADVGTRDGAIGERRRQFKDSDPLTFNRLAFVKGIFPSRKRQFCTEYLKLRPQQRWCRENLHDRGIEFERYIGVRADESHFRARLPRRQWDDFFDVYLNRPILSWSKQQCFDFLKKHGEPVNPLYTMGFNRVGCAPCINSNKDDIRNWAARFPEMIAKVRHWEEEVGRTFFAPMVPGMEINNVDAVVSWSKMARGGKMLSLPFAEAEAAANSCVSKYGLCE
jgi:3'-phosphoadenosine 5'-phosphosulfate sulfotransferase (PAPS reductase)/FAD synthetase